MEWFSEIISVFWEWLVSQFSSFFGMKEAKAETTAGTGGVVPSQPSVTEQQPEQTTETPKPNIMEVLAAHCEHAKINAKPDTLVEIAKFEQYFLNPNSPHSTKLRQDLEALTPAQQQNILNNISGFIVSLDAERVVAQSPVATPEKSVPENVKADKPGRTWSEWGYQTFLGPKHNDVLGHTHNLLQWAGTVTGSLQATKLVFIPQIIEGVATAVGAANAYAHGESVSAALLEGSLRTGVSFIPFGEFGMKQVVTAGVKGTAAGVTKIVAKEGLESVMTGGVKQAEKVVITNFGDVMAGKAAQQLAEAPVSSLSKEAAAQLYSKDWITKLLPESLLAKFGMKAPDKVLRRAVDEAVENAALTDLAKQWGWSSSKWSTLANVTVADNPGLTFLQKVGSNVNGHTLNQELFKDSLMKWTNTLSKDVGKDVATKFLNATGTTVTHESIEAAQKYIAAEAVRKFAVKAGVVDLAKATGRELVNGPAFYSTTNALAHFAGELTYPDKKSEELSYITPSPGQASKPTGKHWAFNPNL